MKKQCKLLTAGFENGYLIRKNRKKQRAQAYGTKHTATLRSTEEYNEHPERAAAGKKQSFGTKNEYGFKRFQALRHQIVLKNHFFITPGHKNDGFISIQT